MLSGKKRSGSRLTGRICSGVAAPLPPPSLSLNEKFFDKCKFSKTEMPEREIQETEEMNKKHSRGNR